jgi:hypothetical protein
MTKLIDDLAADLPPEETVEPDETGLPADERESDDG